VPSSTSSDRVAPGALRPDAIDELRNLLDRYEELLVRLRAAHIDLRDRLVPQVESLGLPGLVSVIARLGELHYRVTVLLASAGLPQRMVVHGLEWIELRAAVAEAVDQLATDAGRVDGWRGAAADTYRSIIPGQAAAVRCVETVLDGVRRTLVEIAVAAAAFYLALLALLLLSNAGLRAALVRAAVSPPAGLLALAGQGVAAVAGVAALLVAIEAAMARSASALVALEGQFSDGAVFPHGRWPRSGSKRWGEVSVTDGDANGSLVG
jgi:hypothetical protein